jgi:biotin carboxylase
LSKIPAMRMLRENPDGTPVKIHATRPDASGPALAFADTRGFEPDWDASDEQYAQFALDHVRLHGIDVLIPTCRMAALAARAEDFARAGCALLVAADGRVARITGSKSDTYEAAQRLGVPVPPSCRVSAASGFAEAVAELRDRGYEACVKPDTGWSAGGFRILRDLRPTLDDLLESVSPVVAAEHYERTLWLSEAAGRPIPDLIVLPYLDDPEISVDCLSSPDGTVLASVARAKDGLYRTFVDHPEAREIAHTLVKQLPLTYLSNVQVRFLNGDPVLLEVNPRASAGVFQTLHTGVNLYWEAVKLAISGEAGPVPTPRLGGRIVVAESTIAMP